MKKIGLVSGILLILLITFVIQIENRAYPLAETLPIIPENVTRLTLSEPVSNNYSTTTDETEIQSFLNHLDQAVYRKIRGNNPSYLPKQATTVYLEGNGKTDFIVIFDKSNDQSYCF
ncbi:hypothetical protein ACFO3D_05725 [Virgibacillus kekensis]|uniref:Uncharacterized protein n=1 Tax=Virgibacillus kekensis TaxID=202261 RepID=A0ABV9DI06_9BACI